MNRNRVAAYIAYASGGATLAFMYAFSSRPELTLFSLAVIGLITLIALRNGRYVLWYVVAFVLGPIIFDIPGLHLGLWSYGTPQFLGFPLWLPFFYGNITISFIYFLLATQGWIKRK